MSIPSPLGPARVATSVVESAAAVTAVARPGATSDRTQPGLDASLQSAPPTRFPWLSRLSEALESAAGRKPAFQPAPVLGDLVDRSV